MQSKPQIIGIAPQLVVPNVVTTAEYYINTLGFSLIGYFMDPPVYAMVQRDGMQLHFGKADGETINHNQTIRKETPDFVIWVPEIEDFYNEVKTNGANIIQDIVQRSYGREFIISDCDGHRILVCD